MTNESAKQLVRFGDALFSKKQNYDTLNQELATWFYPQRADFTQTITLGEEFADHISDATPVRMHRDLANAMGTMIRPADQDWFKITVRDEQIREDIAAKRKLESMTRVTRNALYSRDSNYIKASKEADFDFALFGCSVKSITMNRDKNGLVFENWHLRDCAWAVNEYGMVDQLHRKIKMTARGMERKFGRDKLPDSVKASLDADKPNDTHEIRHVAIPIDMYEPQRRFPKWAQFASIYVSKDNVILEERPESEFPYIVSRWQTVSGWDYGFSPAAITALPDARLIERMAVTIIEASEKSTDPPLVATTESIQGPVDITAGAITWIDAEYDERLGAAVRPLELGKNAGIGQALMDRRVAEMASTFYLDKFSLPDTRDRTATEVRLLYQEFIRSTLPIFEPMESEVVGAELELTVSMLMRMGAYGEDFPDSLQGQDVKFEFQNPLREARDRQVLEQFQESLGVIGAAAQLDPGVAMNVNAQKMFRDAFSVAAPAEWILTEEEVAQAQAAAAEQEAAQQQLAELAQGAEVAQQVGAAVQSFQQVTDEGQ